MSGPLEALMQASWARMPWYYLTMPLKRRSVDVAVAGYPRCGNTWNSALLRNLFAERFGTGTRMDKLFVSDDRRYLFVPPRLPPGMPRVFHGHFMPFPDKPGLLGVQESLAPFTDLRMIVLFRNCKDVMVSYHAYELHASSVRRFSGSLEEFVRSPAFGVENFVAYYNLIANMRRRSKQPTLVTHYEELWTDPVGTLRRTAQFIGMDAVPEPTLRRVVEHCRFENMRRMEAQASKDTAVIPNLYKRVGEDPQSYHVRKGGIGNWTDKMSPDLAAEIDTFVNAHLDPLYRVQNDAAAAAR